jgi:hypothetical protein
MESGWNLEETEAPIRSLTLSIAAETAPPTGEKVNLVETEAPDQVPSHSHRR